MFQRMQHSFRLQYEQSFAKLVPQQIFTYECPSYNALGTEMVLNNAHYRRCLLVLFSKTVTADNEEKKIFIESSCLLKHLTKARNLGPCLQDGIQNLTLGQADSKNIFFQRFR